MNANKILGLVLTVVISSCVESNNDTLKTIDIDLHQHSSNIEMTEIVEDIQLIRLETGADIIGSINKVIVGEDCILVLDKQQESVFIFSQNGDMITKIHQQGRGPQEYLSIGDITYYNGQIYIFDSSAYRICYYDTSGKFIHRHDICEGYQLIAKDDKIIVYAGLDAEEYEVTIFDNKGSCIGTYMPIDEPYKSIPIAFVNNLSLTEYNDKILLSRYFDYNIYSLSNGQFDVKYSFNFGEDNFNSRLLSESNPITFHQNIIKDRKIHSIDYFIETDGWLSFQAGTNTVLYRKNDGCYITSSAIPALYKVLFARPALAYKNGYHYIPISANNLKNVVIPLLKRLPSGIMGLDKLINEEIDENGNDWLLLVKLQ